MHYGKKFNSIIKWKGVPVTHVSAATKIPLSTLKKQFRLEYPDMQICDIALSYLGLSLEDLIRKDDLSPAEIEIMSRLNKIPGQKRQKYFTAVLGVLDTV